MEQGKYYLFLNINSLRQVKLRRKRNEKAGECIICWCSYLGTCAAVAFNPSTLLHYMKKNLATTRMS